MDSLHTGLSRDMGQMHVSSRLRESAALSVPEPQLGRDAEQSAPAPLTVLIPTEIEDEHPDSLMNLPSVDSYAERSAGHASVSNEANNTSVTGGEKVSKIPMILCVFPSFK